MRIHFIVLANTNSKMHRVKMCKMKGGKVS